MDLTSVENVIVPYTTVPLLLQGIASLHRRLLIAFDVLWRLCERYIKSLKVYYLHVND